MSEDEVEALVEAALSIGIPTPFDSGGYLWKWTVWRSLLGKVLKRRPDLRDQMWIQSKCGIRKDGFTYFDFRGTIFWTLSMASLERLQIEPWIVFSFTDRIPSWEPEEEWRQLLITWTSGQGPSFWGVQSNPYDDGIA